jgi:DNA-binding SARP family transcriptional activator
MEVLQVFLFGPARARFGDGPFLNFPTEKTLELLALATLNGPSPIPRGTVAAALSGDTTDSRSRRALSTDIWQLRRLFAAHGCSGISGSMVIATGAGERVAEDVRRGAAGHDSSRG